MLISEMVPVKQSVKNWTEMVTVQVFYGLKATPDQFKARIESGLAAACPKSESHPVAQGEENGYPSMVWLQNCPLNKATGKPEITWFKAIQGNDSFYIVQVAFKAWPSKEQITQWMRYLKEVTVCDTRLLDRAAPPPGPEGRAKAGSAGARRAAVTPAAMVIPSKIHMAMARLPCSSVARSAPTATICTKPLASETTVSRSTWTANRRHRKTTARQSTTAAAA